MTQIDWKSWCYEADPEMKGRETRLVYRSKHGKKFYRSDSSYMYEHSFTLESEDGTVYRIFTDGASVGTKTATGKSPTEILMESANGTTYSIQVDNDGVLFSETTSSTTESIREYLAKDGGSYYLKIDDYGYPYLETTS